MLTESLVLAALGGVAGLAIAWWSLPVLIRLAPDGVPRLETAALNAPVLAAALALVLGSALFVGLLPAWQATRRTTLTEDLGDGKGALSGALKPWMRQLLIGAQAALVMIVLAGAALLVRSAINLQQEPIGFDTRGVLTARVALPAAQYGTAGARPRSLPAGARSRAGLAGRQVRGARFAGAARRRRRIERAVRRRQAADLIQSRSHFVTPDYFTVINNPLKAGRTFTDADIREAQFVMIINETLARAAFGDENPIGKRISCCEGGPGKPHWKTVVGVVADVKTRGPAEPARAGVLSAADADSGRRLDLDRADRWSSSRAATTSPR